MWLRVSQYEKSLSDVEHTACANKYKCFYFLRSLSGPSDYSAISTSSHELAASSSFLDCMRHVPFVWKKRQVTDYRVANRSGSTISQPRCVQRGSLDVQNRYVQLKRPDRLDSLARSAFSVEPTIVAPRSSDPMATSRSRTSGEYSTRTIFIRSSLCGSSGRRAERFFLVPAVSSAKSLSRATRFRGGTLSGLFCATSSVFKICVHPTTARDCRRWNSGESGAVNA